MKRNKKKSKVKKKFKLVIKWVKLLKELNFFNSRLFNILVVAKQAWEILFIKKLITF